MKHKSSKRPALVSVGNACSRWNALIELIIIIIIIIIKIIMIIIIVIIIIK